MSYRYICRIPDGEAQAFQPSGPLPESLKSSLRWFLMAIAARLERAPAGRFHCSAMVHAAREVNSMRQISTNVTTFLDGIQQAFLGNDPVALENFRREWEAQRRRVGRDGDAFEPIAERMRLMAQPGSNDWPEIRLENYRSNKRVQYENLSKGGRPARYIVIGGDILARGLTLVGLCSTWFLRGTDQADSLEQRARWFGRHRGFSDLVQVWLDAECIAKYREIQRMNQEVRESLAFAKANGLTPRQFIPALFLGQGLVPTGGGMGQPIKKAGARYTLRFNIAELESATNHINRIYSGNRWEKQQHDYLIRGVDAAALQPLLQHNAYREIHSWNRGEFAALPAGQTWNLLLKGGGDRDQFILTDRITLLKAGRKGSVDAENGIVSVNALYTPDDFLRDLTPDQRTALGSGSTNDLIARRRASDQFPPLLVIYPVTLSPTFAQMIPGLAVIHPKVGQAIPGWRADGIEFDPAIVAQQLGMAPAADGREAGEDAEIEDEALAGSDQVDAEEIP